ncbi:phosphotransferase [Sediminicoccus sp. KRV36]|uniref:phosphotransferase n=1 Tax=Sediminicoccus sp. KRV36 TaxID=3133721 RepID=UPI00200DC328|nr:phosphotransferase [Sediminicoccus rosea]UPY36821.1 phosphotransferase [Sediminicoccus rosea]
MTDEALLSLARRLAATAGQAEPLRLTPLTGGKNNRVFRVETTAAPLVLKAYHRDPRDSRDRLGAEWAFLRFAWGAGVRSIPEPLAQAPVEGVALYPFITGARPTPIDAGMVAQAAGFIVATNRERDSARLAPGSEACFSMADHVATVDRRVARFSALDPSAPHREAAAALIETALIPAWQSVRGRIRADDARLAEAEIIASPSDFGFHNALADHAGQLTFLDFEYAGMDDPAKLACDFFCCPEVPVPLVHRPAFLTALREGIGLDEAFERRAEALLDAYRVKWACIILNEFMPMDAARRAAALPGERAERARGQLDRAAAKLAEIAPL